MKWGQFVTDKGRPRDVFGCQDKTATAAQKNCRRRKNIAENNSRLTKNTAKENYQYMDSQQLEVILYKILNQNHCHYHLNHHKQLQKMMTTMKKKQGRKAGKSQLDSNK